MVESKAQLGAFGTGVVVIGVVERTADVVEAARHDRAPRSVIVVGAGIVGLSTAWFLQEHGVEAIVVDRSGTAGGTPPGSAAWVAPGLVPLHEPAMLRYGLSSLTHPRGTGDPDPGLGGFLARIAANRRWSSWTRAVRAHAALSAEYVEAFETLTANGVDSPVVEASVIAAFRTMRQAEGLLAVLDRLDELEIPVTHTGLFGATLRDEMPLASPALTVGVCIEDQRYVDAAGFTDALARSVVARGGVVHAYEAVDVQAQRGGVRVHTRGGPLFLADAVVVATGAHLPDLAARCGVRPPLRTGYGLSFTVPVDRRVPGPVYLPEAAVTLTPRDGRLHVASTTGFRSPPDPQAWAGSVVAAVRPQLDGVRWHERGEVWTGADSTASDGRPLVGAAAMPGVYVAGAHDMWGFTRGPATGRLLADQIVTGTRPPALNLFDPQRAL